MESLQSHDYTREEKHINIYDVFGDGSEKLMTQIGYSNPSLTKDEIIDYAWALIPEATAYMMPATGEDLTEQAINIYESYEGFRRIQN